MRKRTLFISLLMILTLALAACGPAGEGDGTPVGTIMPTGEAGLPNTGQTAAATEAATEAVTAAATETATEEAAETEQATATVEAAETEEADSTPQPTRSTGGSEDVGEGVIGIPQTGGGGFVGLAAMFDFEVLDSSGESIGSVADYVVNTCEANILYIVVDRADGQQILIPYQATLETPNSGSVDAQAGELMVNLSAADLDGAPSVDLETLDFQDPTWETEVLDFWESSDLTLSLTSGCNVPSGNVDDSAQQQQPTAAATATQDASGGGSPTLMVGGTSTATTAPTAEATSAATAEGSNRQTIYRIALASRMIGADLQEGNGTLLGTLRDAAIVPETGRTQFLVFEPFEITAAEGNMFIPLPPGAVTIEYADGADQPTFVLLVDTNIFRTAPQFDFETSTTDDAWFSFWETYVPMTLEQLP